MASKHYKIKENIKVKEDITAKFEFCSYVIFYNEFKKHFDLIQRNDRDNKESFILSFLFLYLTFESLVTKTIRIFLYICGIPRRELFNKYLTMEENEQVSLRKRILWFIGQISSVKQQEEFKRNFDFHFKDLSRIRNMIVHGYEISYGDEESQLFRLLTRKNLEKSLNAFWNLLENFFEIVKNFNIKNINIKLVQSNQQFLINITDEVLNSLKLKK